LDFIAQYILELCYLIVKEIDLSKQDGSLEEEEEEEEEEEVLLILKLQNIGRVKSDSNRILYILILRQYR